MGGAPSQTEEQPILEPEHSHTHDSQTCGIPEPKPGREVIVLPVFVGIDENCQLQFQRGYNWNEKSRIASMWFRFKPNKPEKDDTSSICRNVSFILENLFNVEAGHPLIKRKDIDKFPIYKDFQTQLRQENPGVSSGFFGRKMAAFVKGPISGIQLIYQKKKESTKEAIDVTETAKKAADRRISNIIRLWGITHIMSSEKHGFDAYAVVIHISPAELARIAQVVAIAIACVNTNVKNKVDEVYKKTKKELEVLKALRHSDSELQATNQIKIENIEDSVAYITGHDDYKDFMEALTLYAGSSVFKYNPDDTRKIGINGYTTVGWKDVYDEVNDTYNKSDVQQRLFDGQLIRSGLLGYERYMKEVFKSWKNNPTAQNLVKDQSPEYMEMLKDFNALSENEFGVENPDVREDFTEALVDNTPYFMTEGKTGAGKYSRLLRIAAVAGSLLATAGGVALWRKHGDNIKSGLSSVFKSLTGSDKKARFAEKELISVITELQNVHGVIKKGLKGKKDRNQTLFHLNEAIEKLSKIAHLDDESSDDEFAVGVETSFHDSDL